MISAVSRSAMLVLRVLSISLAIISSVVGAPYTHEKACTKPSVRKEWRAFSAREKAAWIRAINVRVKYIMLTFLLISVI